MMLEDPYVEAALQALSSPDYVMGLEYPPSSDFVSEPVYPEFMPSDDDDDDVEEDEDEDEEEAEEEHPASANSIPPPVHHV
ncbi:hypothetical protein Tco_0278870, partial [Tanacetum coccineum]